MEPDRTAAAGIAGRPVTTRGVGTGLITLLVAVGAAVVAWWPTLGVGFLGDDLELVARAGVDGPTGPVATSTAPVYRPLALWSLRLDHVRAGLDPSAFHLTNLVLTGVAAWLVGWVVHGLWSRSRPADGPTDRAGAAVAATTAAALFVLWPSHGEVTAWIGGRGDLLCVVGCLGSLAVWLRAEWAATAATRWGAVAGSVLLLVAGLASKETAVVWPVVTTVLVAGARWSSGGDRRTVRAAAVRTWPLYVAVAVWALWRAVRLGAVVGGYGGDSFTAGAPFGPVRRVGSVVVRSVVWALPPVGWWVAAAVTVAAVVGLVVSTRGRRRHWVWPWATFAVCCVVTALPGAGLGVSATGSIGERLAFLPSVFVVAAAGWAVGALWGALWSRRRGVAVALASALVVFAVTGLVVTEQRWVAAGEAGRSLTTALGQLEPDRPAVLLTVHDELDGAYVGRNAVPPVLGLVHGWRDPSAVWGASSFRSDGPVTTTAAAVPAAGGPPGSVRWRVAVDGPGAAITELFPRAATATQGAVLVERVDDRTVEVTVEPAPDGRRDAVVLLDVDRATVLTSPDP